MNHLTNPSWEWRSYAVPTTPQKLERSINKIDIYSNRLPHKYEQYLTAWGYIMQSRTILVLRLIPDKGRSKALPLFIAMRGISNNFLVHLPSWHDELRVCKEKQIKLLLMFQNVIRLEKTSNSESVSLPVWRLEIFCWGDMKKTLIKGRSLESVWSLLNLINIYKKNKLWEKWNMMKTKLILVPFSFPCHSFYHTRLWANQFCWRSVGLALGKRNNPKVVCLNAIEGFD